MNQPRPRFYAMTDTELVSWIDKHNPLAGAKEGVNLLFDDIVYPDDESDDEDEAADIRGNLEAIAEEVADCLGFDL